MANNNSLVYQKFANFNGRDMTARHFYLYQHFSDFEEFCDNALNWDLDFRQLEYGAFNSEILTFGNSRVIFSRGRVGRRMLQRGGSPPGMVTFGLLASPEIHVYWRNKDVSGEQLFIFPPGGEYRSISQADFDVFVISLTEKKLDEVCTSFQLPELRKLICGHEAFQCNPQMLASLRKFLLRTEQIFPSRQHPINNSHLKQLENELSEQVIRLLADSTQSVVANKRRKRDLALKSAVNYIHESRHDIITISSLCEVVNVSQRTLEYAFRERYGLTPKEYTVIHRLNNVRKLLRAAEPGREKVTKIAQQNGFWHMGQFSSYYKRLFGESPSATLKQDYP